MKAKTANIYIYLFTAATVVVSFIQPTVIHQIVTWAAGAFCVLVVLALFAIGNWPEAAEAASKSSGDSALINLVSSARKLYPMASDADLANMLNIDADIIRAIPR